MTLPELLSKFGGSGDIQVRREYGSTEIYTMLQYQGSDRYLSMPLEGPSGIDISVGGEFMRLGKMYINNICKAYADNSAGVTLSGTWSQAANVTYPITGRLAFSGTTGDYIEFTTDDGVTCVGAQFRTGTSGGGIALVSIDGNNTLADLLDTAQDLVTAGTLPDTVLVANGGTLNPTDRVIDNRLGAASGGDTFSSSLTAGVHTVRITVTGYKIAASANVNILFHAFFAYGSGLYDMDTSLTYLRHIVDVFTTEIAPVWEISYNMIPTGATNPEWVGHSNSLKFIELPTITIDGVETTLNKGQSATGQTAIFDMQFSIRHSEIDAGATELGTLDMQYRMNAVTGLDINHTLDWSSAGVIDRGYPGMMNLGVIFDRGRGINKAIVTLDDDNDALKANHNGQAMVMWDYDGYLGAVMSFSDYAIVDNFANSGDYQFYIDDDSSGLWNKMRLLRFVNNFPYTAATTWVSSINYRIKWFEVGANVSLA